VDAESSYRSFRPDFGGNKPKSKWPKDWRSESDRLKLAANFARAKYSYHLATVHDDEEHKRNLDTTVPIILREGRLKP
jgi:hypothetical protein